MLDLPLPRWSIISMDSSMALHSLRWRTKRVRLAVALRYGRPRFAVSRRPSHWRLRSHSRFEGFASSSSDPTSSVSYGSEYDPTILGGLRMANLIFQSLGNAQENHWYASLSPSPTQPYTVTRCQGTGGPRSRTRLAAVIPRLTRAA